MDRGISKEVTTWAFLDEVKGTRDAQWERAMGLGLGSACDFAQEEGAFGPYKKGSLYMAYSGERWG